MHGTHLEKLWDISTKLYFVKKNIIEIGFIL